GRFKSRIVCAVNIRISPADVGHHHAIAMGELCKQLISGARVRMGVFPVRAIVDLRVAGPMDLLSLPAKEDVPITSYRRICAPFIAGYAHEAPGLVERLRQAVE